MYTSLAVWIGIIAGGVAGCLVLWAVLFQTLKVPFKALGGHPGKQLWSVLFMIPVPLILSLVVSPANWLLALIWLAVAPSLGVKLYFGPKNANWGQTLVANAIYGVAALVVYWLVVRALS